LYANSIDKEATICEFGELGGEHMSLEDEMEEKVV